MRRSLVGLLIGLGAVLAVPASAGADLGLQKVGSFDTPTYVTSPPGNARSLFVTERDGVIRMKTRGRKGSRRFLNIRKDVTTKTEGGLLSMAFAPDYRRSRKFYVYYVDNGQNIRVDEFRARKSGRKARRGSRRNIIRIKSPNDTHKGGQVQMTPGGYLLLATGDGGDFQNPSKKPQKRKSLLGKLLRIKPVSGKGKRNWRPHPDNPYAGKGKKARKGNAAILALGLRNPYRFSLDRKKKGRIVIGDVGHSRTEEVNAASLRKLAGDNFGWPCYEGTRKFKGCKVGRHSRPDFTYSHSGGRCSITGGYVNRAPGLPRQGEYFFGDYCTGEIRTANLRRGKSSSAGLNVSSLVSFGEDGKGNLYTVSLGGSVERIVNR